MAKIELRKPIIISVHEDDTFTVFVSGRFHNWLYHKLFSVQEIFGKPVLTEELPPTKQRKGTS